MKFSTTVTTLLLTVGCLLAQGVTNLRVQQRTDGTFMVDIWYDIVDPVCEAADIGIKASEDNGVTWNLKCSSLSGDKGYVTTPGTDKHIVWDYYADHPNTSGSQLKIQILYTLYGTMTGNDDRIYKTIKIGNQWWMRENLRETKYRDGSDIVYPDDIAGWQDCNENEIGARGVYDNDESYAESYGYVYNMYACADSRNIAPPGWHLSTDEDWIELEMFMGMSEEEANKGGVYRGTDQGNQLKTTRGWYMDGYGSSDIWHFSATPGSFRKSAWDGGIMNSYPPLGYETGYWASTNTIRMLFYYESGIQRRSAIAGYGFSVRLVKD